VFARLRLVRAAAGADSGGRRRLSDSWSSAFLCWSSAAPIRSTRSAVTASALIRFSISPSRWSLASLNASKARMKSSKACGRSNRPSALVSAAWMSFIGESPFGCS